MYVFTIVCFMYLIQLIVANNKNMFNSIQFSLEYEESWDITTKGDEAKVEGMGHEVILI